ncbi:MAG: NAD-dependent epimerase/dehydratase family protein [Aquidulcibacter sp.]|nr:NAD-dependent epimerase/dehydratase family protein [Aquidulcibacter sp.]
MRYLVTGSAGFIGFHICKLLLEQGHEVNGIDSFTNYYDSSLKEKRNELLETYKKFRLGRIDIEDKPAFLEAWQAFMPEVVIHLAAQAGVRYSIEQPDTYVATNIVGTYNILEIARHNPIQHLLIASTSSVYGANERMPFIETERTAHPMSLYAATKGATELIGHSYSHLYNIPLTFFRFFTVYGPWGRPDMALFKFVKATLADEQIDVYNEGKMIRDFTYVGDLVESVYALCGKVPGKEPICVEDSLSPVAPFRVVNIGGGNPTSLMTYIECMAAALGKKAKLNMLPMQSGDVAATNASVDLLKSLIGFVPTTPVAVGVPLFVKWYREYFQVDVDPAP